jgi:hypothetical protein
VVHKAALDPKQKSISLTWGVESAPRMRGPINDPHHLFAENATGDVDQHAGFSSIDIGNNPS